MNENRTRCEAPAITEVEGLLTEDQRRLRAATENVAWPLPASLDEECMELIQGPTRMRKSSEVSRVLSLLDEIGKDGAR